MMNSNEKLFAISTTTTPYKEAERQSASEQQNVQQAL